MTNAHKKLKFLAKSTIFDFERPTAQVSAANALLTAGARVKNSTTSRWGLWLYAYSL
jgi:hypothetical protein